MQQRHRPPGSDGLYFRAPARHMAEQGRAHQPRSLLRDHLRPPAGARAGFAKARLQRTEAQCQFVAAMKVNGKIMGFEHALGAENFLAVQEDFAERCQTFCSRSSPISRD